MKRVGIIGGGQLARMLALAGHPLGVRCRVLDAAEHPPAADVAEHVRGAQDDPCALERFGQGLDVVTYEVEHVPVAAFSLLARCAPIHPRPEAATTAGDRLVEKRFLSRLGIATAPFLDGSSPKDARAAVRALGLPLLLKTRTHGYDGRGQMVIRSDAEVGEACARLGSDCFLAEGFVPFERELSIIAARSTHGDVRTYPVVENRHRDGILVSTLAPAPALPPALQASAEAIATTILAELDYVGVLTVEMFECRDGLLVNEIAPRVHNSGHWTIEGAATSQFENHLRAVLGLPLGSTAPLGASALVNLLGELPRIEHILERPDTHVHLYNKAARPGRKIGHVTARADTPEQALRRLDDLMRLS